MGRIIASLFTSLDPTWRGGYVYMLHASICRTDTAAVRAEDVSYALGSLQVRQYDPVGNLRKAGE